MWWASRYPGDPEDGRRESGSIHQSSHVGDEFLLGRPGFNRVNLSFEELEAIVSYDNRWGRVYAGGATLVHREPTALDRLRAQWGLELRGPTMPSPILGKALEGLLITPILGADFKSFEELKWIINTNVIGGIEWSMEGSTRRFRVLANYYHGFAPYGQFFAQKDRDGRRWAVFVVLIERHQHG